MGLLDNPDLGISGTRYQHMHVELGFVCGMFAACLGGFRRGRPNTVVRTRVVTYVIDHRSRQQLERQRQRSLRLRRQ